jgi:Rhodopirellula transposase DDE domain
MIVDLISNTTTTTGLTVHCVLDTDQYPTGIKYTAKDVAVSTATVMGPV